MVQPDYRERLAMAMGVLDGTRPSTEKIGALAKALDVSYTAIAKIWRDGGSKTLAADNHSRAARHLRVDPDWLATGDGSMHSTRVWPFGRDITPEDFALLEPEDIRPALVLLNEALSRRKSAAALGEPVAAKKTRARVRSTA